MVAKIIEDAAVGQQFLCVSVIIDPAYAKGGVVQSNGRKQRGERRGGGDGEGNRNSRSDDVFFGVGIRAASSRCSWFTRTDW